MPTERQTDSSRRRGPRNAATSSVWTLTVPNKPATEMFGDVHEWAGCGVTKELSFLLVRLCGLCPRVLV